MTTNDHKPTHASKVTRIEDFTRRGPDAAIRRRLNVVKRQPISLARALGDRAYVRNYNKSRSASDAPRKAA